MISADRMLRQRRTQCMLVRGAAVLAGLLAVGGLSACAATIPSKFTQQAAPGVTLSKLKASPQAYTGKIVILGGVIVDKKEEGGHIWLKVKNRPLDHDYVPHIPMSIDDSEAGYYWVMVNPQGLSQTYRDWARMTVVGLVSNEKPAQAVSGEPVLAALYLRGWGSNWGGYGQREDVWEDNQAASYISATPKSPKQF
ncbi:MAG: Slp family lipoprotein [Nitrospirae bacterium]|nr:Slp family lipoprotein [Nitrospirota bacterium]